MTHGIELAVPDEPFITYCVIRVMERKEKLFDIIFFKICRISSVMTNFGTV